MIDTFIQLLNIAAQLFILLIVIQAVMSFVLPPYHPAREWVDRIVGPFLNPIRRVVPLVGMFDFSPLILIILVQLLFRVITSFLFTLR